MTDINIHEGDFYRHFKGQIYQIRTIATNSEDESLMVVYQAMYPPFKVWVRPLSMFTEKLDTSKHPDAGQTYRFEKINFDDILTSTHIIRIKPKLSNLRTTI